MAFLPAPVAPGPAVPLPSIDIDIPNPIQGIGSLVGGSIVDAARALLRALADDFLKNVAAPVAEYVLHTPDLLAEPSLRRMWLASFGCLVAVAGLLVAIAGAASIPGSSTRLALAAREALGVRLASGLLTAAVSLPLVALEVELANRIVDTLVPAGFAAPGNPAWTALTDAVRGDAGAGLALLVTTVVGVVLLVVLVVLGLARWATLWLLVVLAPVAMGFSMLPGGAGAARMWWRLQLTAVFLPVAHAVLLGTYVAMFSSQRSGLVGALSGVAVLGLMAKLPGWAAGAALGLDSGDTTGRVRHGGRSVGRAVAVVAAVKTGGLSAGVAAAGGARFRTTVRHPRQKKGES